MPSISRPRNPNRYHESTPMTKIRILTFIITLVIVSVFGYAAFLYAQGYRINRKEKLKLSPNGLLILKSDPDGAQIIINGIFKTATNSTIPLPPDKYDVTIQKEGYLNWNKRLSIDKEVVTESTAQLFKSAPSLSALTFSSIVAAVPSRDFTKIAYIVPPSQNGSVAEETEGLWVMELINLPIGFSHEPKRVTNGNLANSELIWSPDGREILVIGEKSAFLLNAAEFINQNQRVNIFAKKDSIVNQWKKELEKRSNAQLDKLPDELNEILLNKAGSITFSPDKEMLVYSASSSANIPDSLIKQLPGASTQKQERDIKVNHTYVYDIKEDRNFLVDDHAENLIIEGGTSTLKERRLSWFPTSRHLVLAEPNQIIIMDYDGTNRQVVYAGSYLAPYALPTLSIDRLIILTNLGANLSPTNLYSLGIK